MCKRPQEADPAGQPRAKRPQNSFMHFSNANRAAVKEKNPRASIGDVAKELGNMWRGMSAEEKKQWEDKAAQDKSRYQELVSSGTLTLHQAANGRHRMVAVQQRRCEARAERQEGRMASRAKVRSNRRRHARPLGGTFTISPWPPQERDCHLRIDELVKKPVRRPHCPPPCLGTPI